jgi:hypothetical protein
VKVPHVDQSHQKFHTNHKQNTREVDASEKFAVQSDHHDRYFQQWTEPAPILSSNLYGKQPVPSDDLKFSTRFFSSQQPKEYVQQWANKLETVATIAEHEDTGVYEMKLAKDDTLKHNPEFFKIDQPEEQGQEWKKNHEPETNLAIVDDNNRLFDEQSSSDERLKRNPELYSFQHEAPEENSWTINVGIIEDNKVALGPNKMEHGSNSSTYQAAFQTYGFDQGRSSLQTVHVTIK